MSEFGKAQDMEANGSASQGTLEEHQAPKHKESCIKYIDALWFCYSPVYQITEYYREGNFDSCLGKWRAFGDCMLLRTAAAPRIRAKQEAQEREMPHMWQFYTPEEAAVHWQAGLDESKKSGQI